MAQSNIADPRLFKSHDQKTKLYLRSSVGGHGLVAEITVSAATARTLRTQIDLLRTLPDYDAEPEMFEAAAEAALALAAPDLVEAIRAVTALPDRFPALVIIRGLQVCDDPVPTPLDGVVRQHDVAVEAAILAGVMRHFGLAGTAFASENDGRLIRAVCPVMKVTDVASSQGARADLTSHVDNGNFAIARSDDVHPEPFPVMNTFQFFTTITRLAAVPMRVKLNDDVFARYDPRGADPSRLDLFDRLFEPLYCFASPPSHGGINWVHGLPVLVRSDDPRHGYAMRLHGDTTRASTPASTEALALLKRALSLAPEEVIYTRRGDVVGYVNMRVTHRREPFHARYDESDRYYLRVYGNRVDDVARWADFMSRNGRVM